MKISFNKFLKLFILIIYLIGLILIILSNVYKDINLAKIAMGLYILFGLTVILQFFLRKK